MSLVPELLSTHPFFATSEPDADDPAYIGMVVIVLNAALKSPTIVPILPSHTRRHYPYLRDQYPELLPEIALDDMSIYACALSGHHIGMLYTVGIESLLVKDPNLLRITFFDSRIPHPESVLADWRIPDYAPWIPDCMFKVPGVKV